MAQFDYFLKLEGVKGESQSDRHKDEIDVLSFSWGVSQTGTFAHGGGGGEGKAPIGGQPQTPWGKPALGYKTRNNKRTDRFIVRRRNAGRRKK